MNQEARSHPEKRGVNQAYRMESVITYPGRFWNRFGFL